MVKFYVQENIKEEDKHKMKLYMFRNDAAQITHFFAINSDSLKKDGTYYLFTDIYSGKDLAFDYADLKSIVQDSILLG